MRRTLLQLTMSQNEKERNKEKCLHVPRELTIFAEMLLTKTRIKVCPDVFPDIYLVKATFVVCT